MYNLIKPNGLLCGSVYYFRMRSSLNADVMCWSGGRWIETGGYISSFVVALWPPTHLTASSSVALSSSTDRVAYLCRVRTVQCQHPNNTHQTPNNRTTQRDFADLRAYFDLYSGFLRSSSSLGVELAGGTMMAPWQTRMFLTYSIMLSHCALRCMEKGEKTSICQWAVVPP